MNLRARLETRIKLELARHELVAGELPTVPEMAERAEAIVHRYVEAVVHGRNERRAVLERSVLAETWPLDADNRFPRYLDVQKSATTVALLQLGGGAFFWPKEVSLAEVIAALKKVDDPDAKRVAELISQNRFQMVVTEDGSRSYGAWRLGELGAAWFGDTPETPEPTIGLRTISRWDPRAVAVVVLAEAQVQADRRRRAIAIDAGKAHQGLVSTMRDFPKKPGAPIDGDQTSDRFELLAPNEQIQLSFGRDTLGEVMVETLRKWRGWGGLRNWAGLQRLLSVEGGREGRVRWTLDQHLDALGYSQRSREDPKVRAEIGREVELLTKVELAVYAPDGTLRMRQPLLNPTRKFDKLHGSEWALEGMELEIHPWLYRGVRDPETGKLGKNWFPQALEVAKIDHARFPYAIALGLVLPMRWRWQWKPGRDFVQLRLSGSSLLSAAGLKFDQNTPGRTWRRLNDNLNELVRIGALGRFDLDGATWSLQGMCTLYPPAWVLDRTVHELPPVEPRGEDVPATGAELVAWRKSKGLSQPEAAQRLGVSAKTISRAETLKSEPLKTALAKAFAAMLAGPVEPQDSD